MREAVEARPHLEAAHDPDRQPGLRQDLDSRRSRNRPGGYPRDERANVGVSLTIRPRRASRAWWRPPATSGGFAFGPWPTRSSWAGLGALAFP